MENTDEQVAVSIFGVMEFLGTKGDLLSSRSDRLTHCRIGNSFPPVKPPWVLHLGWQFAI